MNESALNQDRFVSSGTKAESLTTGVTAAGAVDHDTITERLQSRARTLAQQFRERISQLKPKMDESVGQARRSATLKLDTLRTAMRENPIKFTAIATGAGFVVGLTGRYLRWRLSHPKVRVIETAVSGDYC
jgi:ElaB/YqjD/DUF883 family membrane-anchored ribosome-binding protein